MRTSDPWVICQLSAGPNRPKNRDSVRGGLVPGSYFAGRESDRAASLLRAVQNGGSGRPLLFTWCVP